jgi:NAD-dependent SIR2 family protein deacetylase
MERTDPRKIVIFSGAGVSAESGWPALRDAGGQA